MADDTDASLREFLNSDAPPAQPQQDDGVLKSFLNAPSQEEQDHIKGASQILQEVTAGKHPDMTEEELLPIVKLASRDPTTGQQTTPAGRLAKNVKSVATMTVGDGVNIAKNLAGEAWGGIKGVYSDAQKNATVLDPAHGMAKTLATGAVGDTASFLGDTAINTSAGTANLISQAAEAITGQKYDDPDLTNARAAIMQGKLNSSIHGAAETIGVNPESSTYHAGGLIGQALIPIGGEAKAASKVAKAADAIVETAPKVAGVVLEKGAQAAQNKYVQAATATAAGHPMVGLGILGEGTMEKVPVIGRYLRSWKKQVMDASLGKVEGLGRDLRAIPEGPYRDTLIADAQAVADKNNVAIKSIASKEELPPDSYVFQKHDDGTFVHPDDSPLLSKPEKEIRRLLRENDNQASKIDQINKVSDFTKVAGYASKLGLATAGNIVGGASIGGILGGVNAQPGDDESAKKMAVMGAMIATPFAPFHASGALRDIRAEAGREAFKEAGKDAITPDHPNYGAHQEAYNGLNQQGKDAVDVANGMLKGMGGKGVVILPKEEFVKMQGGDASKSPSRGFVRDGTIYLNGEKVSQGVLGHELTHFLPQALGQSVFDIMPDLKAKMEGKETSQAYKDFEKYYNSLSPDSSKTNIPEEVLAETGRRVLTDLPPELFYGGESGADVLKRWGGKILATVAPEWYNKNQVDSVLKAPISKADEAAVRAKLFEIGQRRGQEPPRNAPDEPSATTIPPDPSKRATEPTVTPEQPISAPPGAVEALAGLGEKKASAQAKVDAATAEIQNEGGTVTLEEVVRRAVQKTVPTFSENPKAPRQTPVALAGSSAPESSLSQAVAPTEGRSDVAKAPPAPAPIEEIPKQSAQIAPQVLPKNTSEAPAKNIGSSGEINAQGEGVSSQNRPKVLVAIRLKDGRIVTAPSHSMAYDIINDKGLSLAGSEEGFSVNGEFLYRDEAFKKLGGSTAEDLRPKKPEAPFGKNDADLLTSLLGEEKPNPMLVGPRTDKYGRKSVSGREFNPELPEHAALAEKAGLDEANIAKLKELSDKMGETVGIDYSHAPEEGEGRKTAQKKTLAQARIEGAKREKLSKTFVPTWIEFTSGTNKAVVRGFSPDKFFENAKTVFDKYPEVMEGKYRDVNDPQLISDFQKYAQNHANGYTGMGKPIEGTELTPVKPNPNFEPNILPEDRASVINLLMGDTSAAEGVRKASPVKLEKRALAKANAPFFDESVGETNKIRASKGDMGLEPVSETLRPELIDKIREPNVADEHTIRPSGAAPESRASLAKAGTPNSTYVASGFMPDWGSQRRAKAGGEFGENGEWYQGGKWIANTDMPKRVKEKIMRAATGREQIEPGYGADKYALPEAGDVPILARMGGSVLDPRTGELNRKYIEFQGYDAETIKEFEAAAEQWKDGRRYVSVYDFPRIASYKDAARLVEAGKPVPGALLDKMPEDVRATLTQASKSDQFMPDSEFKGKTIEAGEPTWSIRLKELETREWNGGKLTDPEQKELLSLHKQAREEYGSYVNWFEKMGAEKDYVSGVFGDEGQKQAFMPSPHIEREAERLGLNYMGDTEYKGTTIHAFNDPITKSTISIKSDAEKGALQEKLRASREKFGGDDRVSFMPSSDNPADYRGEHGAPDKESGAPLHAVSSNGIYPEDVYGGQGRRYYGTGDDAMDNSAHSIIQSYKNLANRVITVYRAVPKSVKGGITPGDWITPIRRYAIDHGKSALNGEYKIQSKMVHARDIFTNGDSWLEWGYDPQPFDMASEMSKRERRLAKAAKIKGALADSEAPQ